MTELSSFTPLAFISGWIHPALLGAIALAAVPLIIHLLNRQRHKPMPWAAMRFVMAAYKRTRKRARLEELLLLFLRMAAIALLALAIARPFAGKESPLAGLTESRQDLILCIDTSASMGFREGVESSFDRALARGRELLAEMAERDGEGRDRVRLVLAGQEPRLLSWRSPEEALSVLATVTEPSDEGMRLARTLEELVQYGQEEASLGGAQGLTVRLLSDLQRSSFAPEIESSIPDTASSGNSPTDPTNNGSIDSLGELNSNFDGAAISKALDELRDLDMKVIVEDMGSAQPRPNNFGIRSVDVLRPPQGPGSPIEVAVTVENFSDQSKASLRVALRVDGERRPSQNLDISSRSRAQAVFSLNLREAGYHTIEALLDGDGLAIDDRRATVVRVPDPLSVLLVNGAPAPRLEEDELGFLATVLQPFSDDLDPAATGGEPFITRMIEPDELAREGLDLNQFDVIVLANVSSFRADAVERLEARVAAGAGLLFAVGDRVDTTRWNRSFWSADQTGLLPAELGKALEVRQRENDYWRISSFDEEHPALRFFGDERWKRLFVSVPVFGFLSAEPQANARVLVNLDDAELSPLLIEKDYDQGKVALWTTSLDPAWCAMAQLPQTFVPLSHELLRSLGSPREPTRNVPINGSLSGTVASFPRSVMVKRPDGSTVPLDGEPESLGADRWRLPAFSQTQRAGLYTLQIEDQAPLPFAVSMNPQEGDLERMGSAELASLHPALVPFQTQTEGDTDEPTQNSGELWRWLAAATLLCMVLESLWAAHLGRKRRIA